MWSKAVDAAIQKCGRQGTWKGFCGEVGIRKVDEMTLRDGAENGKVATGRRGKGTRSSEWEAGLRADRNSVAFFADAEGR